MNTETKDDCKQQLRDHVLSIVTAIEGGYVCDDPSMYDDQYEEGDIISASDYLSNVLDIEYYANSKKEYLGANILVAFGGPNIWIDTKKQKVIGAWWGDYFEMSYSNDAMDIDGFCSELWGC